MATNRHASIRYQALDRCFRNRYHLYNIDDLRKECTRAIYEFDGTRTYDGGDDSELVSRRTIFSDINFMRSDAGWSAPIERFFVDGKKPFYRYEDPTFSINNRSGLSAAEVDSLKEAMVIFERFKGLPGFEWIQEMTTNLKDKFHLSGFEGNVIGYENNPYLEGLHWLSILYNYIINRQAVTISYNHFEKGNMTWVIHPYYLKQYNNRWFLFGLNDYNGKIYNAPLDRISDITPSSVDYIPNTHIDFENEYFDDVVGVSVVDAELTEIVLQFSQHRFPYISSKPIHPSQKLVDKSLGIISIQVRPNRELDSLLLSYGADVTVISPTYYRDHLICSINESLEKYSAVQDHCTY